MFYFVFRSLIRNFGYRRNYFRSGIKRKIVFPFVFRSLIRNFETSFPTYFRSEEKINDLFCSSLT